MIISLIGFLVKNLLTNIRFVSSISREKIPSNFMLE